MVKKLSALLLVTVMLMAMSITAFASSSAIRSKSTGSTGSVYVTITRPDGDESTFKKSYVLCGVSDVEDIRVELLKYDSSKGEYVPFQNVYGESSWNIGVSGIFMKEIELDKGANKIRIVAYKNSDKYNLKVGRNLQVNNFTVTLLDQGIKGAIKSGMFKIGDFFSNIF